MIYRTLLSGVVLSTLAACASHSPPTRHLGAALAATSAAQEAGATRVPPAALHLSLAREQIAQAERMIDDGMNERASDLTVRAYNDAKLAAALAHEAELKQKLAETKRDTDPALMPNATSEPTPSKQPEHAAAEPEPPASAKAAPSAPQEARDEEVESSEDLRLKQQRTESPGTEQPEEN